MIVPLITLILAALLAVTFGFALGWRRPGREATVWGEVVLFFVIVWLTTWALVSWTQPPPAGFVTAPLLAVFFIATVISLVIAAVTPSSALWPRRRPAPGLDEERARAGVGVGVFFWVLILLLVGSLLARYVWWTAGAV